MGFGDLKSDAGLKSLDDYLSDKSYVEGYVPSQGDVAIFSAVGGSPNAKFVNALRWFNQISSYNGDDKLAFPGVQKPLDQYGNQSNSAAATGGDDDDDDFDMFGSDNEEDAAEAERLKQERLKEIAAAAKSKKKPVVAKSSILLDVKVWDDEADMKEVEAHVRSIQTDGLLWGASRLVPLAYGINKLQISCVVEDDKVGTDFLEEEITAKEDLIQSVDIAAFNKI